MLYLTVHLYGRQGVPGEFKAYEQHALDLFRRHGGEVLVAYTPQRAAGDADTPDEIQVLRIADQAALDAFMTDPQRTTLAAERERVIRRTVVYQSDKLVSY